MWDVAPALLLELIVQYSIGLNDLSPIAEHRKRPAMFFQPACCFGGVVLGDGKQNRRTGFNRIDCLLQLTELLFAERSPGATAKKLDINCLFAFIVGKAKSVSLRVFELEIRRLTPHFRPLGCALAGQRKAGNQDK